MLITEVWINIFYKCTVDTVPSSVSYVLCDLENVDLEWQLKVLYNCLCVSVVMVTAHHVQLSAARHSDVASTNVPASVTKVDTL